jgi:formylglycine-generating enzyme required for sulfatase activity
MGRVCDDSGPVAIVNEDPWAEASCRVYRPDVPFAQIRDAVMIDGVFRLGEPGAERAMRVGPVVVARWPVTCAEYAAFVAATGRNVPAPLRTRLEATVLANHPVVHVTHSDATAYGAWAGGRLPTGDEWEAAARGAESQAWPWGGTFDATRCNAADSGWGTTTPVDAYPEGASWCGAEDLVGNVWEWVADPPDDDGWRRVRGGCHLDTGWGLRPSRALAADPVRATATTGFRIAYPGGDNI